MNAKRSRRLRLAAAVVAVAVAPLTLLTGALLSGTSDSATGRVMLWRGGRLGIPFELVNESTRQISVSTDTEFGVFYSASIEHDGFSYPGGGWPLVILGVQQPAAVLRPGESFRSTLRVPRLAATPDPLGTYEVTVTDSSRDVPSLTPMRLHGSGQAELYLAFPPYRGRLVPPKPVRLAYRG